MDVIMVGPWMLSSSYIAEGPKPKAWSRKCQRLTPMRTFATWHPRKKGIPNPVERGRTLGLWAKPYALNRGFAGFVDFGVSTVWLWAVVAFMASLNRQSKQPVVNASARNCWKQAAQQGGGVLHESQLM